MMIGSSPKPVVKPKMAASTVAPKTDLWRSVETMPKTNDSKTIAPANSNINADVWKGKSERETMPFCNRYAKKPMTNPTTKPLLCVIATSPSTRVHRFFSVLECVARRNRGIRWFGQTPRIAHFICSQASARSGLPGLTCPFVPLREPPDRFPCFVAEEKGMQTEFESAWAATAASASTGSNGYFSQSRLRRLMALRWTQERFRGGPAAASVTRQTARGDIRRGLGGNYCHHP